MKWKLQDWDDSVTSVDDSGESSIEVTGQIKWKYSGLLGAIEVSLQDES